ncbi:MAG: AI-2E family transporter [bacterium]|nr:AI-2E family transporter [bacterium]
MTEPSVSAPASPVWSGRTKRTIALIALVLIGLLLWQVAGALTLVVIALVVSFLLNPITTFLERRILKRLRGGRGLAILLTFVLVLILFVLLILIILPALVRQVNDFAAQLPEQLETLETNLTEALSQPLVIGGQPVLVEGEPFIPLEQLNAAFGGNATEAVIPEDFDLIGTVRGFLGSVTTPTFRLLGGAFSAVINLILTLTMMFYLLKDGTHFVNSIVSVVPDEYKGDARRLFQALRDVWNAYLRGQLILSSFIGTVVFLAATLLGVPNAPVLGLISFMLEFIPTIGPLIALIPAGLLALLSTSATIPGLSGIGFALVVIVVWTVIQNVQAILVTPRVMGDSLDLHPIIVIIGVLGGASIGGALGVILAAPTIASVRVLGGYVYHKLMDRDPFPEVPDVPRQQAPPGLIARLLGRGRTTTKPTGRVLVVQSTADTPEKPDTGGRSS